MYLETAVRVVSGAALLHSAVDRGEVSSISILIPETMLSC